MSKRIYEEVRSGGLYYAEDHGANVAGVFFKCNRCRKGKYVATANVNSLESIKRRIERHENPRAAPPPGTIVNIMDLNGYSGRKAKHAHAYIINGGGIARTTLAEAKRVAKHQARGIPCGVRSTVHKVPVNKAGTIRAKGWKLVYEAPEPKRCKVKRSK